MIANLIGEVTKPYILPICVIVHLFWFYRFIVTTVEIMLRDSSLFIHEYFENRGNSQIL